MMHSDRDNEPESGKCLERRCLCESFKPKFAYTPEQLTHMTVPLEGLADTIRTKAGEIIHK